MPDDELIPPVSREILEAVGKVIASMVAAAVPVRSDDVLPELFDRKQTADTLGLSLTGFTDLESRGFFGPQPIRLGDSGRIVRYSRRELVEWVAAGCPGRQRWNVMKSAGRRSA